MFKTSFLERHILFATLCHKYIERDRYGIDYPKSRVSGIPQGNTLSSFLANIASHELDEELDRNDGVFVRYADDLICINYSYHAAINCAHIFNQFERKSGIRINRQKSLGIRLYSDFSPEIANTNEINFLNYKIEQGETKISDKKIKNIKRRCSKIVYDNLLQVPKQTGHLSGRRFNDEAFDWDLVNCINQLRKYIYGKNSERAIRGYLGDRRNIKKIDGIVGYYCLVTDPRQFRELDGWLVNIIQRAYRKRAKLARGIGHNVRTLSRGELLSGDWYHHRFRIDPRIPSFYYGWRAASKSWSRHGVGAVDASQLGYFYEED